MKLTTLHVLTGVGAVLTAVAVGVSTKLASDKVNEIGLKIVKKYGFDKLESIAKLNFKNTEKIKELYEKEMH